MTATADPMVDQIEYLERRYELLLGEVRNFAKAHKLNRDVWQSIKTADPDHPATRHLLKLAERADEVYDDAIERLIARAER